MPTINDKEEILTETDRQKKAQKIEKHLYDAIFFILSAATAYFFCIGQDWLPWYMGGQGDLNKHLSTSNLPFSRLD